MFGNTSRLHVTVIGIIVIGVVFGVVQIGVKTIYEKGFEENAVELDGVITYKNIEEHTESNMDWVGVFPVTHSEKVTDYIFKVKIGNQEHKIKTNYYIFNEKEKGQKVKVKKYKNDIRLVE